MSVIQAKDVIGRAIVEDEADVVIIGTGAAGATAARVLTEAGVDVIMIEEGPLIEPSSRKLDAYSSFKTLWRDMGFQAAEGRAFYPVLQGCAVGGTTVINGAIIHRLPEEIHATWAKEYGLNEHFRYEEFDRVFNILDGELSVGPALDPIYGRNNALMKRGADAIGIRSNRIRRNVIDCAGSGRCNQGCPTDRKQSMNATYVPQAIAAGARLYATCRVDRIETKGGRAVGVRGSFRHPFAVDPAAGTGKVAELHVRARKAVIVACSAIQTPILLGKNGIGKRSKMLGRRLQTHPGTGVSGVFDEPVKMWFGATQGHESVHWWDERMKLETVGMPLELGAVRLPGFGAGLVDKLADFGHVTMWGVQVRAETHGRVKRGLSGRTVIKYDMGVRDVQRMKIGVKRLTELQFAAGARAVYPGVHGLPDRIESVDEINAIDNLPDDPRLFHCIMAHLFGTAVMGTDPRTSVVDPSLQTHDLEGLYVFDSSVFPTNMGVNPQHSICAMSWLAAEKLRSEL